MYIKNNNKKINIIEYIDFKDRFKSFKFYLKPIDFGIKISKKRYANTYFFCQRVDICFTDQNNKIIYLYKNVKSEKLIIKLHRYNIYYLPVGTCSNMNVGDILKIKI